MTDETRQENILHVTRMMTGHEFVCMKCWHVWNPAPNTVNMQQPRTHDGVGVWEGCRFTSSCPNCGVTCENTFTFLLRPAKEAQREERMGRAFDDLGGTLRDMGEDDEE